jgi:hypothetical protein
VGETLTRFFSCLFVLGAAIGIGTIGVAALSSDPAAATTVMTVNDAGDPTSPTPGYCITAPEGDCSLRAALEEATTLATDATINLPDPTTLTPPGSSYFVDSSIGELQLNDTEHTVTLVGAGASVVDIRAGCIGVPGCSNTRVMEVQPGASADISGVTISNGNGASEGGDCGGICDHDGHLTLMNSTVSDNTAITFGGGIGLYEGGSATLTNDTITGNTVSNQNGGGGGGGISIEDNDTTPANLTIRNTTISGNEVDAGSGNGSGGGIDAFYTGSGVDTNRTIDIDDSTISGNQALDGAGLELSNGVTTNAQFDTIADNTAAGANGGGNLNVQNASTLDLGESIVAGGVAGGSPENCSVSGGSLHSLAYNLIDDTSCGTPATGDIIGQSPQLGGLAANGGPTLTQLPASTSPAISAVPASVTSGTDVTADQRGDSRGQGVSGSSTIGSVEVAQAPPVPTPTPTPTPTPHGYWLVGSDGGIFTFGSSQFYGSTGNLKLQRPVVGISPTSDRNGYWMVASDGGVFAYGDAGFVGSIPGVGLHPAGSGLPHSLNAPIVGMVPSHDGGGYFMVASDGGVFAFGDAFFAGSCPGIGGCSGSAVAVMPDASGNGYWIVTNTGNVYGFGDAAYYGSPGHGTVTSAVATPNGKGYWILLSDGEVFAYGSAANLGSPPAAGFNAFDPANAIFATSDGAGYWVSSAAGAVYPFGDAPNDGSMAGTRLNAPIIAGNGY